MPPVAFRSYARSRRLLIAPIAAIVGLGGFVVAPSAQGAAAGTPFGAFDRVVAAPSGALVQGWAIDPNTTGAIKISVQMDGRTLGEGRASSVRLELARAYPRFGSRHGFSASFTVASGRHRFCLVAVNVAAGANRTLGCRIFQVVANPTGHADGFHSAAGGVLVQGWSYDPDAVNSAVLITITEGGRPLVRTRTGLARPDVVRLHPAVPSRVGYSVVARIATGGVHTLCANATNIGAGSPKPTVLDCRSITVRTNPVGVLHAVKRVSRSTTIAVDGWVFDPQTAASISVRLSIDGATPRTVSASLPLTGLRTGYYGSGIRHAFSALLRADGGAHRVCATAVNVGAGLDTTIGCRSVAPSPFAPVTSPALISTSRYIRNINGGSGDAVKTRAMGAADAAHNPSNHRYLMLLQIGGQTTTGVILSATSTFVTYAQTVAALRAYIDGYAGAQRINAPALIAIGTNNDIDVRAATGAIWARQVTNPLRAYAVRYRNITIAGANDIEPGFIGTLAASQAWVSGYLGATPGMFVFNGSADGCGSTVARSACNNRWTAAGLAWMSGAAAPARILSLPQIYNSTMPKQWKYISLTNVVTGRAKVTFAGPLTEWTACVAQRSGCSSLTNNVAWTVLWAQLQSDVRVRQASLPYGTDLRIN